MDTPSPMNQDIRKDKHVFILDVTAYHITFVFHLLKFINFTVFFPLLLSLRFFFLSIAHLLLFSIGTSWKLGRSYRQEQLGKDTSFILAGPDFINKSEFTFVPHGKDSPFFNC